MLNECHIVMLAAILGLCACNMTDIPAKPFEVCMASVGYYIAI